MPELPEIQTLSTQLASCLPGRSIQHVSTRQPKSLNLPPEEFAQRAAGPVTIVRRIGKSVVATVPQGSVWIHLGVNGQLLLIAPSAEAPSDPVVSIELDDGSHLFLQRIFMGHAHFFDSSETVKREATFGLDPLSEGFTAEALGAKLRKKPKASIKQVLMDQAMVAGIGNAYADEVLAAAHVHPLRATATLSPEEIERIVTESRKVLLESVSLGGDNDYTDLYGARGRFSTRVHNQSGCWYCGSCVEQTKVGGRTTYFCPACQPAG